MKLYQDNPVVDILPKEVKMSDFEVEGIDEDLISLENCVDGYSSLSTVYSQVAEESFNFVDKNNHVLFNEYMTMIGKKLGVSSVPLVSTEAIEVLPTVVLNHHLALEGFIADMWQKVKNLFKKLYENIKEFFKRHFTRIGSLKKKLNNLKEVLSETDKDIKEISMDKVPSNVASKFPYSGTVNEGMVAKAIETADIVVSVLEVTNKGATNLAKQDIVDRDFVAKVKSLKDQVTSNKENIDTNNKNKTTGLKKFVGEGKANNKDLNEKNKTLSEMNKDNEKEVKNQEGKMNDIIENDGGLSEWDESAGTFLTAKNEMEKYIKTVETAFNKLVGKPIPGGRTVSKVTVTADNGIDIEFDTNKDSPDSITLGSKSTLIKIIGSAISSLETMEKATDNYTTVNDMIMKNMDTVDKLISEVDKITSNANYAKYKRILQVKVKERLKLMQTFFTTYNKLNKNLIGVVADSCDGAVAYTVASLKNFG